MNVAIKLSAMAVVRTVVHVEVESMEEAYAFASKPLDQDVVWEYDGVDDDTIEVDSVWREN